MELNWVEILIGCLVGVFWIMLFNSKASKIQLNSLALQARHQEDKINKITSNLPYDQAIGESQLDCLESRVRELEYLCRELKKQDQSK